MRNCEKQLELEGADLDQSLPLLLKLAADDDFMTKCVSHRFLRLLHEHEQQDLYILTVNTLDKVSGNPSV